ncbi:hypothetical protein L596_026525 [Steinernema carpocapsae]|uniref:Uncharacterized protein n=1 Tax=Steinernema carpocapsae TaxID=34508 RepID=A0A4U5M1M7_STECR|nr:hypothetical protein L596_026525 [Steinernema carpocapsae]
MGNQPISYQPHKWNSMQRVIDHDPRTSNAVQAWHQIANKYFYATPQMSKLLTMLKNEETRARQVYREYCLNPAKANQ